MEPKPIATTSESPDRARGPGYETTGEKTTKELPGVIAAQRQQYHVILL